MLIFLYGPDDYRREEKKRSIRDEFLKKYSDLSVGRFDALEEGGVEGFRSFARNQSIFETKKIIFLERIFDSDREEELAHELMAILLNKNTTVVLSEKGKPLKAFAFLLKKPALAQEFKNLEGKEWEKFIADAARDHGMELDSSAVMFLARVYAGKSWGLITEIQKLSSLGKKNITQKDLEGTMLEVLPDYWSMVSGLRSRNVGERISMLEKLFSINEPPAKIFNILASLWKERVCDFADYDLKIKSGKLDYEEALVDAMLK